MTKLDWEKAKAKEVGRSSTQQIGPSFTPARRQKAIADFVHRHRIRCFKCGAVECEWAKAGISKVGPWAICRRCVKEPV